MEPMLHAEHLSIGFSNGNNVAVVADDISFSVQQKEFVAIVGESGSGKSVTAFSILQLLPPGSEMKGNIFFNGELISAKKKSIKQIRGRQIGMIFQEPMTSLNPLITCGEQVKEVIRKHLSLSEKKATAKVVELFREVELPDPANIIHRFPHELSGGQKQRVMIAMAIACDPLLLIADEPTTALDASVQATILALLKKISREKGLSVLLITHDLGLVADVADKIIVLQKGKIVEQGNTKEVLEDPQHPYTKGLLACRPASNDRNSFLPVMHDLLQGKNETIAKPLHPKNDTTVLALQNISVVYKSRSSLLKHPSFYKAVDDVSFSVLKNEIVGLVGESGCGKTTLGKAILKLINVQSGNIFLEGTNITNLSEKQFRSSRKNIQVVFQDPYSSLNPSMKIGDAIAEPLLIHGMKNKAERKQRVIEMLEKLELNAEHYSRYPHEFSGGQRQRICIARALILKPSFVVFDESVSALDVSVQAQVLNLITKLKDEMDFSAIFISHDLGVVHYISDRIIVMQKGKIVEEGDAEKIYNNPQHPYTQMLVNAVPGKAL